MSNGREIVGVALFIGALGFGVRAASAYQKKQGEVWLDYEPPTQQPTPRSPINLGWLDNLWGSGGGGGYSPTPTPAPSVPSQINNDVLTLARTIYGEAASETQAGKEAVANVVINRARDRRWPSSIASVCRQPWQFSCWNANDPMRARIENKWPGSSNVFDQCVAIAETATRYQLADRTGGATHYYANYIGVPAWVTNSPNARVSVQIGVHKFYTGIA